MRHGQSSRRAYFRELKKVRVVASLTPGHINDTSRVSRSCNGYSSRQNLTEAKRYANMNLLKILYWLSVILTADGDAIAFIPSPRVFPQGLHLLYSVFGVTVFKTNICTDRWVRGHGWCCFYKRFSGNDIHFTPERFDQSNPFVCCRWWRPRMSCWRC